MYTGATFNSDFGTEYLPAAGDCHCTTAHNGEYFRTFTDLGNKVIHMDVGTGQLQRVGFRTIIQNPGTGSFVSIPAGNQLRRS